MCIYCLSWPPAGLLQFLRLIFNNVIEPLIKFNSECFLNSVATAFLYWKIYNWRYRRI